ncbi:MAG TPA: hemolysin family protein [Acidimicrobiales bacterium]|nr:hemolysin family protein [Acidimicrobiales bacterium]
MVILVLVVVNGVFVAAEFALVGARRSRLESMAGRGNRAARWLVSVFDRPMGKDRYIAIAQLGITLASIGLGMYGEPAVAGWLYGPFEDWGLSSTAAHTLGFVIALSAITYMHVVFGEMIPKALALQTPERVSIRVNPVMQVFGMLFRPMVAALNAMALGLMRLLRIPEPDKRLALYTSAELAIVTDEAADSGQLGAMQRDLIRNIFELDERTAEELMTSRSRVEVFSVTATPEEIAARIAASPRSRYPVVDGDLDRVVGVLHIKDFIRAHQQGLPLDLERLVRPATSVAASASAEQLLAQFKRDRMHASLVVDEFGGTLGFVTLDDIIAEVMDVHIAAGSDVVRRDDGSLTLDGEVTLSELRDHHRMTIEHPDVTTIAGLVLAQHGTVPAAGVSVRYQGYDLMVEQVEGHKITRVAVRPVIPTIGS